MQSRPRGPSKLPPRAPVASNPSKTWQQQFQQPFSLPPAAELSSIRAASPLHFLAEAAVADAHADEQAALAANAVSLTPLVLPEFLPPSAKRPRQQQPPLATPTPMLGREPSPSAPEQRPRPAPMPLHALSTIGRNGLSTPLVFQGIPVPHSHGSGFPPITPAPHLSHGFVVCSGNGGSFTARQQPPPLPLSPPSVLAAAAAAAAAATAPQWHPRAPNGTANPGPLSGPASLPRFTDPSRPAGAPAGDGGSAGAAAAAGFIPDPAPTSRDWPGWTIRAGGDAATDSGVACGDGGNGNPNSDPLGLKATEVEAPPEGQYQGDGMSYGDYARYEDCEMGGQQAYDALDGLYGNGGGGGCFRTESGELLDLTAGRQGDTGGELAGGFTAAGIAAVGGGGGSGGGGGGCFGGVNLEFTALQTPPPKPSARSRAGHRRSAAAVIEPAVYGNEQAVPPPPQQQQQPVRRQRQRQPTAKQLSYEQQQQQQPVRQQRRRQPTAKQLSYQQQQQQQRSTRRRQVRTPQQDILPHASPLTPTGLGFGEEQHVHVKMEPGGLCPGEAAAAEHEGRFGRRDDVDDDVVDDSIGVAADEEQGGAEGEEEESKDALINMEETAAAMMMVTIEEDRLGGGGGEGGGGMVEGGGAAADVSADADAHAAPGLYPRTKRGRKVDRALAEASAKRSREVLLMHQSTSAEPLLPSFLAAVGLDDASGDGGGGGGGGVVVTAAAEDTMALTAAVPGMPSIHLNAAEEDAAEGDGGGLYGVAGDGDGAFAAGNVADGSVATGVAAGAVVPYTGGSAVVSYTGGNAVVPYRGGGGGEDGDGVKNAIRQCYECGATTTKCWMIHKQIPSERTCKACYKRFLRHKHYGRVAPLPLCVEEEATALVLVEGGEGQQQQQQGAPAGAAGDNDGGNGGGSGEVRRCYECGTTRTGGNSWKRHKVIAGEFTCSACYKRFMYKGHGSYERQTPHVVYRR